MSIFQAFYLGFKQVLRYRRIWLLLYLSTLGLALFVALPLKSYLEASLGHSLIVEDMVKGFDYTVMTDFLNNYGSGVSVIMQQSILVILLFLLLTVFMVGGILKTFFEQPAKYDRGIFWTNNAAYFRRMLVMTLVFFVIHALVLVFFLLIYFMVAKGFSPANLEDDTVIFTTWKWLLPLYILVSAFFFMWHDYAKIILVKNNHKSIFRSISQSFRFIRTHFKKTYSLYLLNIACLGLVFLINYFITDNQSTHNSTTIYIGFFLAQFFIIIRLGLRLLNWSSASILYKKLY